MASRNFSQGAKRKSNESQKKATPTHKQAIRHKLYLETFFSQDRARLRKRDAMLSDIIKKELSYFSEAVPATPLAYEIDFQVACEDINDKCQAFAYNEGRRCTSYYVYNKDALKNKEIMNRYFDYVTKNKWAQVNLVNFFEMDFHSPPDKRARTEFADFAKRVTEVREDYPEKQFILVGAGNQSFVALVSTGTTGIDKMAMFTPKNKIRLPYWWDEHLMFACPPEDRPKINPVHCPTCAKMTPEDFTDAAVLKKEKTTSNMGSE